VGFGTRNRTWQRGRGRRQFPHLGNGGSSPGVLAKSLARKSICDLYLALEGAQLASPLLHGSHNQNCGCHSRNGMEWGVGKDGEGEVMWAKVHT